MNTVLWFFFFFSKINDSVAPGQWHLDFSQLGPHSKNTYGLTAPFTTLNYVVGESTGYKQVH